MVPEVEPQQTIQQRFEAFHAANPWVYSTLVALARQAKAQGRTRIGMKHLVEVVRWEYGARTNGQEFRLDNKHVSRYVRLVVTENPELADLFEMRRLRAA